MIFPLDELLGMIEGEEKRLHAINDCFIYFRALTESRHRKKRSDLFDVIPHLPAIDPTEEVLDRVSDFVSRFVETTHGHPNLGVAFVILAEIHGKARLHYFRSKLRFYYQQGDLGVCYQLCQVLGDLGEDLWRDPHGKFIGSRSSNDTAVNFGVTQRYLETQTNKA